MSVSTTFTPTKTNQTALIAWQDVASATYVEGSAYDCHAAFAASVSIKIGRATGSAFTAGSPNIRIQGSLKTSGLDQWTDLAVYQPQVGANIGKTTANGAISANASTFVVTSATNIAAQALLFLGHTTDPTKYELIRVLSVASTTITPVHNVVNAHDTGCNISALAEEAIMTFSLEGIQRIRAVVDNIGSGQGISAEVSLTTFDNVVGA
jgi:hypothetical protein